MTSIIWIAGFAVLGALLRYSLGGLNGQFSLPVGTLLANYLGCFLIGALSVSRFVQDESIKLYIMVGLLGALTTFSGFAIEWIRMLDESRFGLAAGYFVAMNAGCLALVFAGRKVFQI